jgi:hypothetical protein
MEKILSFILSTFFSVSFAYALEGETLQDRIPDYIKKRDSSFLTLTVENDLFGSGTDENYTNGVRLTYFDSKIEPSKIAKRIGELVPFFKITDTTNIYYSLGHNLYTPRDIEAVNPDRSDRPYAGFLYGSIGYNKLSGNHIDDLEVTLGVVGPSALGEKIQKTVHDWIDSPDPQGWDNQLKDEPAFMIAYQRMWPEAYKKQFDPFYFRVWPHAGATVGNVYTHANAGLTLQLVPSRFKWQALPSRVRPSIPGSGYFSVPEKQMAWSVFAGFDARAVARNIFLDGNTFKDSPSIDKKYGVLDANLGFTVSYGRFQTAYTLNWRSKEFDNQEDDSVFGSVSLGYRF